MASLGAVFDSVFYPRALRPAALSLHGAGGWRRPLPAARWFGQPDPEEQQVLDLALPVALDIGCGPGRHAGALVRRGVEAVGLDVSPAAVRHARRRGLTVLHGSVFDRVPGTGTWGSVLLLDGNVGIGGDPGRLLRRVRALLRPAGRALVELDPPGTPAGPDRVRLALEGSTSPPFRWATVGADGIEGLAEVGGFGLAELWNGNGRWFARLDAR